MRDETNIKTNFLGRDGFRWFIGQIPKNAKINWGSDKRWGHRRRVRIMGYHPGEDLLPDEDLPFANVMVPTTSGSGAKQRSSSIRIEPGDIVVGFFLDGDDAQVPCIIGTFGKTKKSSENFTEFYKAFEPFTSFDTEVPVPDENIIKPDETGEETTTCQTSPINCTQEQAEENGTVTVSNNIGEEVVTPSACVDASTSKVNGKVNNFLKKFKKLSEMGEGRIDKIDQLVKDTTKGITKSINGLTGDISTGIQKELTGKIQDGLKVLYDSTFANVLSVSGNPVAAHLAGVASQKAMVGPVGALQKGLECAASNVGAALEKTIEAMLKSMIDSFDDVLNFPQCMADQFTGALLNNIVDGIGDALAGPLGGISKVLSKGFSITDNIRSKVDAISGVGALFDCGQDVDKCTGLSGAFKIGGGIANAALGDLESVLESANNLTQTLEGLEGTLDTGLNIPNFNKDFSDPLGACFGGKKTGCGKPKVRIFGGNGFGAAGKVFMGALSDEINLSEATASVIGLEVTSPGVGYEFPPFVEIVDECNQGYGAIGRALIKNGQVVSLYVVSEGEGYPPGDIEDLGVIDTVIEDPGSGYSDGDTAVDNFGNRYNVIVDKGGIVAVKPLNINVSPYRPQIRIEGTGRGALVRPVLGTPEFKGEVKQVIDCIDPEENNLVGYVNGKPYYGAYHIHPVSGVKMVGIAHTTSFHEVIYDTPEQSFGSRVSTASTSIVSPSPQTNVSNTTTTSQTTTSSTTQTGTTTTPSQQTSGQSDPPISDNTPSDSGSSGSSGGGSSGGGGYGGGY